MFFNYVSLFNVAAAHPYLVNRCNFSCRVEMQPSHPGIKGQIEVPQAHTERDLHLFLYSFRLHLQFEPQQGDFQHAKQLSRKMWGMAIYPLYVRYFIFVCTVTPENMYIIKNGPRERTSDWNLLQQLCVACKERVEKAGCELKLPCCWSFIISFLVKSCFRYMYILYTNTDAHTQKGSKSDVSPVRTDIDI